MNTNLQPGVQALLDHVANAKSDPPTEQRNQSAPRQMGGSTQAAAGTR